LYPGGCSGQRDQPTPLKKGDLCHRSKKGQRGTREVKERA
jgi:hypothetical protein